MVMSPVLEIEAPLPITNRQRVLELREANPTLAAVRIAEILNITRERVRQILKDEGLPTYIPRHYGFCALCKKDIPATRTRYCSATCRTKAAQVTFECVLCGNSKTLRRSAYNTQVRRGYKRMYCSVVCRQKGNWAFRDK